MVQRAASEYMDSVQRYSVQAASMLSSSDSDSLYSLAKEAGSQLEGRVLIVDDRGIVQVDGYSELNGTKLTNDEIISVLSGSVDGKYGYHLLKESTDNVSNYSDNIWGKLQMLAGKSKEGYEWVIYCAVPIVSETHIIGSMILSISIESIVEQTALIRWQMLIVFLITGIVVLIISAFISGAMVQPIRDLTQGIKRISQGDFSQRVKINGQSELAQMAVTFNNMSQRLEDIDRTRNEFVSNASHELKTPMASIKVLVEALQHQEQLDVKLTHEFLGDVNNEIDRMSILVTELLSLVRQDEEGAKSLHITNLSYTMLVVDVCDFLEPIANKKGIRLHREIEAGINITGDAKLIKRMCINLIENAIKYTASNNNVSVSLTQNNLNSVFIVKDTGIGIPEEQIPYIFDRFYRVDKARSRETGGTGLGLSIVKSIILLHKGEIHVDSVLDKGTNMTVLLPNNTESTKDYMI